MNIILKHISNFTISSKVAVEKFEGSCEPCDHAWVFDCSKGVGFDNTGVKFLRSVL